MNIEKVAPLSGDSVALWHFPISLDKDISSIFWHSLSEKEKQNANNFRFMQDKLKYTFCRGVLRQILSLYTGISSSELVFSSNEFGKPYLANTLPCPDLGFNLSHTSDYVVFTFGLNTELGIDLEKITPFPDVMQIAETFFSTEEYLYLEQLKSDEQVRFFFHFWTKKEAILKAKGIGLAGEGLNALKNLKIDKENRIQFSDIHGDDSFWSLQILTFLPGYVGAIAYRGSKRRIEYQSYQNLGSGLQTGNVIV